MLFYRNTYSALNKASNSEYQMIHGAYCSLLPVQWCSCSASTWSGSVLLSLASCKPFCTAVAFSKEHWGNTEEARGSNLPHNGAQLLAMLASAVLVRHKIWCVTRGYQWACPLLLLLKHSVGKHEMPSKFHSINALFIPHAYFSVSCLWRDRLRKGVWSTQRGGL